MKVLQYSRGPHGKPWDGAKFFHMFALEKRGTIFSKLNRESFTDYSWSLKGNRWLTNFRLELIY